MAGVPIGRFAPSPTGRLHLGSLITAVASFCHIKSLGGRWLLRLEDTDSERCQKAFSDCILYDLDKLGLHWDELHQQSCRLSYYNDAKHSLARLMYPCDCTRKQLVGKSIYPRICTPPPTPRHNHPDSQINTHQPSSKPPNKLRILLPDCHYGFVDGLQGIQWQNPQALLGDTVIWRNTRACQHRYHQHNKPNACDDGIFNYLFACAVDDGIQHISHVMRGLDILPMTAAQIAIQQALGLACPQQFYHLPLIVHQNGQKLSKQTQATPIDTTHPQRLLISALTLLGQNTNDLDNLPTEQLLHHAIRRWDNAPLMGKRTIGPDIAINTQ